MMVLLYKVISFGKNEIMCVWYMYVLCVYALCVTLQVCVYRKVSYVKHATCYINLPTNMPVEDLEGKPFTCHICSKECIYAPLYNNVYVTGI